MKRKILIAAFVALMSLWRVSAQDITPAVTENWTVHTVYTGATGNSLATDITYYNGLGLKEQHIQVGASMSGKSIVKPFGYDSALREAYDYVAYETNRSTYDLQTNAITDLEEFCHNTFNEYRPFYYTRFEAHPDGRPIRVIAPGYTYSYSQRNPTIEYGTNTSSEVRIISSDSAGSLVVGGSYAAGTLQKETVKDEDGRAVITFNDKIGNLILERRDAGDTYYVYDDSFRLRYVITPKAASGITSPATYSYDSEFCKTNCYSYRYDNRRRVVVKRLPQCGEEYLVYDDCDRVIGRQSATDRESGVWRTYAYDPQGRLYREGSINSSKTREEFQNSPEITSGNVYNAYYYYDSYPASMSDDLGFVSATNVVSSSDVVQNTNGLMTYKLVRDPYPSTGFPPKFHFTAYYYDYLGRMIQSVEKDPDGHIHRVSCKYDFTGNVTASVEEMAGVTKKTECTYDERGRLKVEKTYVNGTLLSDLRYSYDIYGHITQRLENKNGLFNNYTFDIHGRQTAHTSHRAGTHIYSDELKYYSTYCGATATYSGNISAWNWRRHDNSCDTLMFLYDSSNRLIKAATLDDGVATNRFSENNITYDRNGNILTLKRYGSGDLKQNISSSYLGNRLSGCIYDSNGNITYDAASGLSMQWSPLNLIKKVSDSNGVLVNYSYLADGTKIRAVDADGEGLEYRGSLTFRRSSDGTLTPESIAFSGGRIVAVTGSGGAVSFVANHHVTDHLGSVRAVVDGSTGQVVETNDYYAFGGRWDRSGSLVDQSNRYRYNGKEEQTTFGTPYSDYGARQYSSASGRWLAVDPLAEKHYNISPYVFCGNNPLNYIDPDGQDWYRCKKDRDKEEDEEEQEYDEYEYLWTTATSQAELDRAGINGEYLGAIVVVFDGYYDECVGKNGSIIGEGAKTATVTVYGSNGAEDKQQYVGYTMTSNYEIFGAIDNGIYDVTYKVPGKGGSIPSNYAVNNAGPVNCLNGINPSPPEFDPCNGSQKDGIYIHRTNIGGGIPYNLAKKSAVSTGCLLIYDGDWQNFSHQIGKNGFKLILNR